MTINQSVFPCPILTVASWPAYRFLRRQVRWSGTPISLRIFHNLLWFTQSKAFSAMEIEVVLKFPCFLYDPMNIGNFIPQPFLNLAWTSGSSRLKYCWSLSWTILSISLLAWEVSTIVWQSEHSLALPLLGIGMKTDIFQSCGHC